MFIVLEWTSININGEVSKRGDILIVIFSKKDVVRSLDSVYTSYNIRKLR